MFPRRFLAVVFLVIMPGLTFALGADVPDYRQNGWSSPVDFRSREYCAQFSQYSGDPLGMTDMLAMICVAKSIRQSLQ